MLNASVSFLSYVALPSFVPCRNPLQRKKKQMVQQVLAIGETVRHSEILVGANFPNFLGAQHYEQFGYSSENPLTVLV